MKVQAIFEGSQARLVLAAESVAEQRFLAVFMAGTVDATVRVEYEGHESHARIKVAIVTLQDRTTT